MVQQGRRLGERLASAPARSPRAAVRHVGPRRPDRVPRRREPRLRADRAVVQPQHRVAVLDPPIGRPCGDGIVRNRVPTIRSKRGSVVGGAQQHQQVRAVDRPRSLSPCGDANDVCVIPERVRSTIHELDEPLDAAGDVDRERFCGVVGRPEEQGVQELSDLDPLAGAEAQHGACPVVVTFEDSGRVDVDDVVELGSLQHDQRRHDLRQARHRSGRRRGLAEQDRPIVEVGQDAPSPPIPPASTRRPGGWPGPTGTARSGPQAAPASGAAPRASYRRGRRARRGDDDDRDDGRCDRRRRRSELTLG